MDEADVRLAVKAYWDSRAPHFDGVASHVRHADAWAGVLAAAFAADGPRDVVDLGAGTGACALVAAGLGHRVTAVDGSAPMLAVARRAAEAGGLSVAFVQAFIDDVRLPAASADIVTMRNVLWTLPRPADALTVAARLLRPGGRVVISDGLWSVSPVDRSTYPDALGERLPLHRGLTEEDGRTLLAVAGFTAIRTWQHLFPVEPYPASVPFFVMSGVTAPGAAAGA
jgi:ubiquinone/menaquinone biosynthesis C-methylase UbiE